MTVECPKCRTENTSDSKYCKTCATPLPGVSKSFVTMTQTLQTPVEGLSPGALFAGRYQIIENLGQGGMGRVLKAFDTRTQEKIALKVVRSELAADQRAVERFSHELTAARKIAHRNVCRMYDLGEDAGRLYITMEYVAGQDLKSILRMMGTMSPAQAVGIAVQICDGLDEAHRLGVIHRDLKPSNILIDQNGLAKIMDFGIARSALSKGITDTGTMIGTPEYMSPEQAEGREADFRSDLYTVGVILFEMATGRLPFESETALGVAMKHKLERPPDPKSLQPAIPADLAKIILRCLEKNPSRRYGNAAELRADLQASAAGLPTGSKIVSRRKPLTSREITMHFPVRRLIWPAAALAVLAAAAILFLPRIFRKSGSGPAAPKIADSVAVAAFDNQTGDPKYDYLRKVIPSLLINNLENAGLFQVATWERMHDLLAQMGRPAGDFIDSESGFAFCRREGIAFLVVGSYTKAGETFVTEFKLLNAETRGLVDSAASRGTGEDSILTAHIDDLSRRIAEGIGVSKERLGSAPLDVVDVTTGSLEAYTAYLQGKEAFEKFDHAAARKAFEEAVRLDPNFAIAHLELGRSLLRDGNRTLTQKSFQAAKDLAGRATEKERLLIEEFYAKFVERDRIKAEAIIREMVRKYPREKEFRLELGDILLGNDPDGAIAEFKAALNLDPNYGTAINQLAYAYAAKEDYQAAQAQFERYVALFPKDFNPRDSLGELFFRLGNLDEAKKNYEIANSLNPAVGEQIPIAYILAVREDYPNAFAWLDQYIKAVSSEGMRSEGPAWKAFLHYLLGRRVLGFEELGHAIAMARQAGDPLREGAMFVLRAYLNLDRKDFELARADLEVAAPILNKSRVGKESIDYVTCVSTIFLELEAGNLDAAETNLAKFDALLEKRPKTEWNAAVRRTFEIRRLVARGQEGAALREAQKPQLFDMLNPGLNMNFHVLSACNYPLSMDFVAQALARRGDTEAAIMTYQRLMTFGPGNFNGRLINPLYHFRIAALYEKKGEKAKAIEHYRKFLELWKDADPELPEPGLTRSRLAVLEK